MEKCNIKLQQQRYYFIRTLHPLWDNGKDTYIYAPFKYPEKINGKDWDEGKGYSKNPLRQNRIWNSYQSINDFKSADSRCGENCKYINTFYIDIDCHEKNLELSDLKNKVDKLISKVMELIYKGKICEPTFLVMTGRGIAIYYALKDPIDTDDIEKKEKYSSIYEKLFQRFKDLLPEADMDHHVIDVYAQVSRIPGTENTNAHTMCRIEYVGGSDIKHPQKYTLDEVYEGCHLSDVLVSPAAKCKATKRKYSKSYRYSSPDSNELRKDDSYIQCTDSKSVAGLKARIDLLRYKIERSNKEGITEGYREKLLFIAYCTCRKYLTESKAREQVYELNSMFDDPLSESEVEHVFFKPKYPIVVGSVTYTYSLKRIMKELEISNVDIEIFGFSRKVTKHHHEEMNKEKFERDKKIIELYRDGYTYAEISKEVGVCIRTCINVVKRHNAGDRCDQSDITPFEYSVWRECKKAAMSKKKGNISNNDSIINNVYDNKTTTNTNNKEIVNNYLSPTVFEQDDTLNILTNTHKNVCITGPGGTGKSYIIEQYLNSLPQYQRGLVIKCAPNALSAKGLHGSTIHKAFGLDQKVLSPDTVANADLLINYVLLNYRTIIIDEVFSCRLDVFTAVVNSIKKIKQDYNIDIRLIVIGDPYQLPPISKDSDEEELKKYYPGYYKGFPSESAAWKECDFTVCELTKVRRQSDELFIKVLNDIRVHNTSTSYNLIEYLNNRLNRTPDPSAIYLCATNRMIDMINDAFANTFNNTVNYHIYDKKHNVVKDQKLAIGMKVMVTKNDYKKGHDHVRNGDIGEIVCINDNDILIKMDDGNPRYVYPQQITDNNGNDVQVYPLTLAYAISIHKSQGMTLDKVNICPEGIFEAGMLYVALSRCKDPNKIHLLDDIKEDYWKTVDINCIAA